MYCKVIFEAGTDLCWSAFRVIAFGTATDLSNYCSPGSQARSGSQGTGSLVDKSSREKVDPVPMVNFVLRSAGTVYKILVLLHCMYIRICLNPLPL